MVKNIAIVSLSSGTIGEDVYKRQRSGLAEQRGVKPGDGEVKPDGHRKLKQRDP